MAYGKRVKMFRDMRKMTQEELALRTGIPPTSLSRIENGGRKVTLGVQARAGSFALWTDEHFLHQGRTATPALPYWNPEEARDLFHGP